MREVLQLVCQKKMVCQNHQTRVIKAGYIAHAGRLFRRSSVTKNQRPSAMKRIMKFSPGKMLSTGFVILAALAAATPQTLGSSCTPPPAGLVSWWLGESNALDSAGANNGIAQNIRSEEHTSELQSRQYL